MKEIIKRGEKHECCFTVEELKELIGSAYNSMLMKALFFTSGVVSGVALTSALENDSPKYIINYTKYVLALTAITYVVNNS